MASEYSEGLKYNLSTDKMYYIVAGLGTCEDTDLIIPSEYNGLPVKRIGDYAFRNCTSLTSVAIGEGITSIGSATFYKCTSLTSVAIPESVTSIVGGAFGGCTSLTSITVDEGNEAYKSIDNNLYTKDGKTLVQYAMGKTDTNFTIPGSVTRIGNSAFSYCASLTSVTIPESVTSIDNSVFSDCTSLTRVVIPESVMNIGSSAFYRCTSLTSVVIGNGVVSIGGYVFEGCTSLTIYCEAQSQLSDWSDDWNYSNCPVVWDYNNNEKAEDGCIYAIIDGIRYALKDRKAIIARQPSNITFAKILDEINYKSTLYNIEDVLNEDVFNGCTNLIDITWPNDKITTIKNNAFKDCNNLKMLAIPEKVTAIENTPFLGCTDLIIFCEIVNKPANWSSDWNKIEESSDADRVPVYWNIKGPDYLIPGQYYRLQINNISNYSISKYLDNFNTSINLSEDLLVTFNFASPNQEYLQSVVFELYKNSVLKETSEEILYNYSNSNPNNQIVSYQFGKYFSGNFMAKVKYKTINGYKGSIETLGSVSIDDPENATDANLTVTSNYDDGYLLISTNKKGKLYRKLSNSSDGYIYIKTLEENEQIKDVGFGFFLDNYNYVLITDDNKIVETNVTSSEQEIEDMFLSDEERILRVRFNAKVSSFKNVLQETKIEAIGSRYPVFFRNGNLMYKEFPINGLITYEMDKNNNFFAVTSNIAIDERRKETIYSSTRTNNIQFNTNKYMQSFADERKFKQEVLAWLSNGKPKLFRSPQEGSYIVKLTNVLLSPENGLNRMLHSFSCTAIEIDEYNLQNLNKYNLLVLNDGGIR